jgi:hypothetical protein
VPERLFGAALRSTPSGIIATRWTMGDPDAQAEAVVAWRTLNRALRGPTQPAAAAAALPERRSLEQEVEAVEFALVWLRALGEACRDRLQTEDLPDARS